MPAENLKYQHDYARLARDSGFCFEKRKTESFDKNKISFVDIERIIEEQDVATVEKLIPCITHFVLDPSQEQVLDVSFVKTFYASQLAIEYLLFCKKYLDNTAVLLKEDVKKLKAENQELNLFVEELKEHVDTLMKELSEKPSFRCEKCNKVFSTEEFLNSHIKRRHSLLPTDLETEKLYMEIKELKGRLNTAEKEETNAAKNMNSHKLDELLLKFEEMKIQVQSELKLLQSQHKLEEKYEKLVDKVTAQSNVVLVDKSVGPQPINTKDNMTQTELKVTTAALMESEEKENVPSLQNIREHIAEAFELNVAGTMEKMENHMESFWKRMNDVEGGSKKINSPPKAKPRSNLTIRQVPKVKTNKNDQQPIVVKQEEVVDKVQRLDSVSESSNNESNKPVKSPKAVTRRPEVNLDILKNEINKRVMGRLQELGVSPEWKGLPQQSFQRAQEILNHQANLLKKTYPSFDSISAKIVKNVDEQIVRGKYRKREATTKVKSPSKLVIRNREMYDTSSESEGAKVAIQPYSAVIQEFKTVVSKAASAEPPTDVNKGVLKSYPSNGSLTKKKVIFNLDSERNRKEKVAKDGDSSTSVASSVFDGTPRQAKKETEKEVEDLSDCDFSEM